MDLNELENLRMKFDLSRMGKPALIGLALIFVMVAVMAGRYAIDTATATEIQLEHGETVNTDTSEEASPGEASLPAVQEPETIYVHVSGAVASSGLVELQAGSRVADAIEAAGGPTDGACVDAVNLARKVDDGEHVHLPSDVEVDQGDILAGQYPGQTGSSVSTGKVNINTASVDELETLPGIGPSIAQKIVAERESGGAFAAIEDLRRVSGIGDKKLEALQDMICI